MQIQTKWLGRIPYSLGLEVQSEIIQTISDLNPITLLGLEHEPVVSMGKRATHSLDLPMGEKHLQTNGFEVFYTDRGGQATIHAPGQLVIYPICHLKGMQMGVRDFVEYLLKVSQAVLADLGVLSQPEGGIGLYTEIGKIAFVGLRISRGISSHGIAINVSNSLKDFELIRSCGLSAGKHDSLLNRGIDASTLKVFQLWIEGFKQGLT